MPATQAQPAQPNPTHHPDARAARDASLFPTLTGAELACLANYGPAVELADGDFAFKEGDQEDDFCVILEGELKVTKTMAGEQMLLARHRPGQFTGALTMFTGGSSIATAQAVGRTRIARIDNNAFLRLIAECPDVARIILGAMARRRPEVEAFGRQREKLAALGKLSAGLAHELNNPASAAGRAASQLQEAISHQQGLAIELCRHAPTALQLDRLKVLKEDALAKASEAAQLDPLERSDREDELASWMKRKGVKESWDLAGTLAAAGIDRSWLEGAAEELSDGCLESALSWVGAALSVRSLVAEVEESAGRISHLIQAIKDYSYMDQAPLQEIDIHSGLESTLTILGYKLRKNGIDVVREYDQTLPKISAYGSELNQVWTNLIVNAIEVLNGSGHIWLHTQREGDCILVEIADDGPGIPKETQKRIFDPFFTTKDVGKGTGLGLDICYRIVVERHHGDLRVDSEPGNTCFQVRLPLTP
ncbi:MAG TPA: ATP-binding protein, partial [Capsulimonadaceae bacterium]|nr:ATP-binding protein [Capsulimonadaceae bacterium]